MICSEHNKLVTSVNRLTVLHVIADGILTLIALAVFGVI